jgi:hypothetical protein
VNIFALVHIVASTFISTWTENFIGDSVMFPTILGNNWVSLAPDGPKSSAPSKAMTIASPYTLPKFVLRNPFEASPEGTLLLLLLLLLLLPLC